MQENQTNSDYCRYEDETVTPKSLYLWATMHTRLCHSFVSENDEKARKEMDEKIEASLLEGKRLLNILNEQIQSRRGSLIPASGLHRFSQPKELLNSKEKLNKNIPLPYKAELGTSTSVKSMPMPSRTYLKKKTPTQ